MSISDDVTVSNNILNPKPFIIETRNKICMQLDRNISLELIKSII